MCNPRFGAVRLVIGLDRDSLSESIFIHRAADLRNGLTLTEMLYRGIYEQKSSC